VSENGLKSHPVTHNRSFRWLFLQATQPNQPTEERSGRLRYIGSISWKLRLKI